MKKGMFITVEGLDASGKTTQIESIKEFFESNNMKVIITREPGGTSISEKIREIILDKASAEMDSRTEALLYAAARTQHIREKVEPNINNGINVVSDRFLDSSLAYQGYGRELGLENVLKINEFGIAGVMPDITFFIDVKPSLSIQRLEREGNLDRLELEKLDFHTRVYNGFLSLLDKYQNRIIKIDGSLSVDEIKLEINYHLNKLFKK